MAVAVAMEMDMVMEIGLCDSCFLIILGPEAGRGAEVK